MCTGIHYDHIRTLKILWCTSESGGLCKHKINPAYEWQILQNVQVGHYTELKEVLVVTTLSILRRKHLDQSLNNYLVE